MTRPLQHAEVWPPALVDAAYHGIIGEIVHEIAPHTEADPVGILAVLLSGIGNAPRDALVCVGGLLSTPAAPSERSAA
jgi:hypothetical protein